MVVQVFQDIADDDVFQYLAAKAGQRNWAVVRRVITLSFLENCGDIMQTCPCNIQQYFTAVKMIIFR